MNREVIEFQRIVRSTSGQTSIKGSCEELINARVSGGTLRPVHKHKKVITATNYINYMEHDVGALSNKLAIIYDKERMYMFVVLEVIFSGNEEILTGAYTVIRSSSGRMTMKALKNMVIINDGASDNLITYQFVDGVYKIMHDGLPSLPSFSITKREYAGAMPSDLMAYYILANTGGFELNTRIPELKTDNPEVYKYAFSSAIPATREANITNKAYNQAILSGLNEARSKDKNFTEGYVLLSLNFTLVSGEETKMTPPVLLDIGSVSTTPIIVEVLSPITGKETDVYVAIKPEAIDVVLTQVDYSRYKNIIRSVNVYTSVSFSHLENTIESINDSFLDPQDKDHYLYPSGEMFKVHILDYDKLKGVLFFKQKELSIESLSEKVSLVFNESLVTEKTMKVDSTGWLKTRGDTFIYNNRVHLYNYTRSFTPEADLFTLLSTRRYDVNQVVNAAVRVPLADGSAIVCKGTINAYVQMDSFDEAKVFLSDFVSFVDSRAEHIYIWFVRENHNYAGKIYLKPSISYNIAFATSIGNPTTPTLVCPQVATFDTYDTMLEESNENSVLVSAIGSPYYFPVEHSYPMPGKVNSLALMAEQISEAQQGQYPLFAFTDRGVYALQQGSGGVLYSSIIPISADIATKSVQTKSGVAYVANGSIMILHGRNGKIVSSVLDGEPNKDIRNSVGFARAHGTGELYDTLSFLSYPDFKTYLKTSLLVYDNQEDELIVSNYKYAYSYVFNFITGSWHKISETFTGVGGSLGHAIRRTWEVLSPAQPARAKVTIEALSATDQTAFDYFNSCVIADTSRTLASGTQVSLVIGASRIAIYHMQTSMPLYMAIEEMCQRVVYVKHRYDPVEMESYIYTSKIEFKDMPVIIKDNNANVIGSDTLVEIPGTVIIDPKGIGTEVSVTISGARSLVVVSAGESYASLANKLANKINQLSAGVVTATAINNVINLVTVEKGLETNNITMSFSSGLYCVLSMDTFSGGGAMGGISGVTQEMIDVYLSAESGEILAEDEDLIFLHTSIAVSSYGLLSVASNDVVSLMEREEKPSEVQMHIQSTPFLLGGSASYSTIKRAILRGEIRPSAGKVFGVYLWASNNLIDWYLISQSQADRNSANIRLKRSSKAWRYFVLTAGGIVDYRSNVAYLEIESEELIHSKIR